MAVRLNVFKAEPEAVAKPNQPVEVTLVNLPLVANKFVEVEFVEVVFTKVDPKAFTVVPDATANPNHCVEVTLVNRPFTAFKVVPEATLKPSQPVEVTLVNVPFVTDKAVATKFAKKALVPVVLVEVVFVANKFKINAEEVTFKLVVTKLPVDVPPPKVMVVVAVFPWLSTCCNVGVALPVGQFVPFARHTNCPATDKLVKAAEVPTMLAAKRLVEVEFVLVPFVTSKFAIVPLALTRLAKLPLMPLIVVPEAVAKPSHPVEVTLVKTPLVAVNAARLSVVPVALVKMN